MSADVNATILVVDDEDYIRRMVVQGLHKHGYTCLQADGGPAALDMLAAHPVDLIVTDLMMPGMTGLELLVAAQQVQPNIAVILLTGVDNSDTAITALSQGAYGYMIKPVQPNELLINVVNALRRRELEIKHNSYQHHLEQEVQQRTQDIRRREEEITLRLVIAAEYRDTETGEHIRRIANYAALIAQKLGWPADQVELLRLAAPMHDIGKIGITDNILLKPDKLTPEEYILMQQHTLIGASILNNSDFPLLQMASAVALGHHERWDGSGYPHHLEGEATPECARIVALADVYDALHTDRIYRPAFPEQEALAIMAASQGQFDPGLFACMIEHIGEFRRIRRAFTDDARNPL
ncbi:MAG: HD domain-containing phosphohydrolase [bacterium]